MARDIYVDCIRRDPESALDAVRRQARALRAGASCLVVLSDDPATVEAVHAWGVRHHLPAALRGHGRYWSLRFFVLPDDFGDMPRVARATHAVRAA